MAAAKQQESPLNDLYRAAAELERQTKMQYLSKQIAAIGSN